MCLFPLSASSRRFEFGSGFVNNSIDYYDCGSCPECLRKRSNLWALRAVYEAKAHAHNCMITLTYDNFIRDSHTGKIIGETIPDRDLKVNQRDVQLFIKRLRKHFFCNAKSDIKYIACAEYGSRTHRAHYHLILFGVRFDDFRYYKKSKRGNVIYMSQTLTNLWGNGICTIDSISVHSAIARYCTKYCAKSRSDNTFMLASQRIGLEGLLNDFNGISYFIDGHEYPIPRRVWQEVIYNRYCMDNATYKYVNRKYVDLSSEIKLSLEMTLLDSTTAGGLPPFEVCVNEDEVRLNYFQRQLFYQIRNDDLQYQKYLLYWQKKGQLFSALKPPVLQRIYALDDRKFHNYKLAALDCYFRRKTLNPFYPAPGSGCVSAYFKSLDHHLKLGRVFDPRFRYIRSCDVFPYIDHVSPPYFYRGHFYNPRAVFVRRLFDKVTCPSSSRPNRASDTKNIQLLQIFEKSPFVEKNVQLSLDID